MVCFIRIACGEGLVRQWVDSLAVPLLLLRRRTLFGSVRSLLAAKELTSGHHNEHHFATIHGLIDGSALSSAARLFL